MTLNLDEIEARANAATSGPWNAVYVERDETWPGLFHLMAGLPLECGFDGEEGIYADNKHDFDFIAHARTDIPNLIQAVRELQHTIEFLVNHAYMDNKMANYANETLQKLGLK